MYCTQAELRTASLLSPHPANATQGLVSLWFGLGFGLGAADPFFPSRAHNGLGTKIWLYCAHYPQALVILSLAVNFTHRKTKTGK